MCLNLKFFALPRKAKEDIEVYKILMRMHEDYYVTPYRGEPIKIGETYTSYLKPYLSGFKKKLDVGIHSFTKKEDVTLFFNYNTVRVKCIIPKGAWYYKGIFNYNGVSFENYASDTLKYISKF